MKLQSFPIETEAGVFMALFSVRGLTSLSFPGGSRRTQDHPAPVPRPMVSWLRQTERALKCALAGGVPEDLPPLDFSSGTEFQKAVWDALREIPAGETRSYAEIARRLKRPRAARAVGGACGANPIPVLVPCHRVLAANRGIGGFSGGLEWKRRLLQTEGVALA